MFPKTSGFTFCELKFTKAGLATSVLAMCAVARTLRGSVAKNLSSSKYRV
jgi:hypothetical protein